MNRDCETCIKRKTIYCPNSADCFATDDKPYYQHKIMLLEENEKLKEQYEKIYNENCKLREEHNINDISLLDENAELKKQVENWKHQLKSSKEILNIQGRNGNYNYDNYMLGLYNGMEAVIALFEKREPNYKKNINLLHNDCEIQQQEFINYLETEKDRLVRECSHIYEDSLGKTRLVSEDIFNEIDKILNKYKEIIGGNKDE